MPRTRPGLAERRQNRDAGVDDSSKSERKNVRPQIIMFSFVGENDNEEWNSGVLEVDEGR